MTENDRLTEEKIFEAATAVFEEKGLDGARMQDIADRAGINKALLHYYFRSKEKLFLAVFDNLAEILFSKFAGIFQQDMPFDEKMKYFFLEHMTFLQQNPKLPIFILTEVSRNPELVDKFLAKIDLNSIKTRMSEDPANTMPPKMLPHLMISIVSLSVMPIAARPIIEKVLETAGYNFDEFYEERKYLAPEFIINAVRQFKSETDNNTTT